MEALENITYDELNVGDSATYTRTLHEQELVLFAAACGDINPLRMYHKGDHSSLFQEQTVHGMWSGALISAALGTMMPGPGTVYLEQSLNFKRPARLNETLTVEVTVREKAPDNQVVIACEVRNQDQVLLVSGQARVIAPTQKVSVEGSGLPEITISD